MFQKRKDDLADIAKRLKRLSKDLDELQKTNREAEIVCDKAEMILEEQDT